MGSINYTDPTEMLADIMRRFQIEGGFPKELLGRFYVMAIAAGIIVLGLFVAMAFLVQREHALSELLQVF